LKLGEVKNPVTGGKISLSVGSIVGMVAGVVVLSGVLEIGKRVFSIGRGFLPGSVSPWLGGAPTVIKTDNAQTGPSYRVY
jgi:hypothetical protein